MQAKIFIKAPAKINLYLKVLGKRQDGYHDIESGINLINLYDEISIKKSHITKINFEGPFKPKGGFYKDCIISRTLEFLNIKDKLNFEINVKKNIPTQAGLGSASTNAAALIKILDKSDIKKIDQDYEFYSSLGSDIPFFLFGKNAVVKGKGEKINDCNFPKYYFLLVKPLINLSTKMMYEKMNKNLLKINIDSNSFHNSNYDKNDFEQVAITESQEIKELIHFLSSTKNSIFARMSGSGSCCYATFEKQEFAKIAQNDIKKYFPQYWTFVGQNYNNNKNNYDLFD